MINWRYIQRELWQRGYHPGPIDGFPGPRTDGAMRCFKRDHGLPVNEAITVDFLMLLTMLETVKPSDIPWLYEAVKRRGLHENMDKTTLAEWLQMDPAGTPWCGAFVAACLKSANLPGIDKPLTARNWAKYGKSCKPQLGAIMVFWRGDPDGWQGHVGFYYGENDTHFFVLGGNQSGSVSVSRIDKGRLLTARWPSGIIQPKGAVYLNDDDIPITTDEA